MDSNDFAEIIASEIQLSLSPHGFQRYDRTFIADHQEVIFLVSLEKQSNSRKDRLVFSLNVSVNSKALSNFTRKKAGLPPLKLNDYRWYSGHWRRNIANALGDTQGMKLWQVETEQQAFEASREIVKLLQSWGLPYLESLSSTAKIIAFLRDGGIESVADPPSQQCLNILSNPI